MKDDRPHRLALALIFGGRSGEHQVSVVSARSVARALDSARYEVVPMAIDRAGRWADETTSARVLADSGDRIDEVIEFEGCHRLDPRLLADGLDVAFPVLHGPFGEDGSIQGLFEMIDLPYVGCDPTSSAICMDKILSKRLLEGAGLPTPRWKAIAAADWHSDKVGVREACLALGTPLFVKPARLGSSVGISKVARSEDFEKAVDLALQYGSRALVEEGLDVRDIEVAVLGTDTPRASIPGEVVPGHEFYDFEDKYLDTSCELLAPAPLERAIAEEARQLSVRVFSLFGCEGMARVDFFVGRADGRLWVNEVNTIPGFTSISMYPRLWGLSGLSYLDLMDELVNLALARHLRR
jgi:D-alanine-D-alanine ligase